MLHLPIGCGYFITQGTILGNHFEAFTIQGPKVGHLIVINCDKRPSAMHVLHTQALHTQASLWLWP